MKIVVLDGYTLNPGDLSWEGLEKLGELTVYDHTPFEQAVERARGAEIVFTNKTPLGEKELSQLSGLKFVGLLATGYNVVDVNYARKQNITVTNIPTYGTNSVAQMVFALILEMTQHVQHHSDTVMDGKWAQCRDFCYWNYSLIELAGKTMGIIGFGRIGQAVADIAEGFKMKVIAYDSFKSDQSKRKNFKWVELDELLAASDFVSLHCPLFPETKGIINKESLQKMKKTAFIFNTSRGPLVVDVDLADALNNGMIAGAGLDVLSVEPPQADNPLFRAKNCLITPHISWATKEARARLMDIAVDNLKQFIAGTPVNVVNQ
ncbi:MAG TPA: glycerate dehydrogenase [Firmicutes bacterium]|nr:glycerate dehydrogenase [Bacillota bacterium]